MASHLLAWSFAVLLAPAAVPAESPTAKTADTIRAARIKEAARQAWSITNLVLEKDIDPPARQQMLLQGIKTLLDNGKEKTPANLAQRVSSVTTVEQFAGLLAEIWPADADNTKEGDRGHEAVLLDGLLAWRTTGTEGRFYLTAEELKQHEMIAGNRYVGTGIQIRNNANEQLAQIVVPFPGGPARKAGARPNDLIVEVDGRSMKGLPLREVVRCLQGEEGTKVRMTLRQPEATQTRQLDMVRSVIPFSSVHGYRRTGEVSWSFRVDPKAAIGYLSLDDIKSSTLLELRKIEPLVQAESVQALVLDLRFTRGDDLRHAALLADGFLDGGLLWRVRDSRGRVKEYKADRDCLFRDLPMVVLVGEHTGNLGAIVAAALQDRGRAVVVGEMPKTELTVTSLVYLPEDHGAVRLRTGRIERGEPAVTERQRQAAATHRLLPDPRVALDRKEMEAVLVWRREQESPEPRADAKPPSDPQLEKAIALLREALTRQEKKTSNEHVHETGRFRDGVGRPRWQPDAR